MSEELAGNESVESMAPADAACADWHLHYDGRTAASMAFAGLARPTRGG
ncbi:hypothetical protein [Streptomyces formicae]|uniref:Uncharacterized protein n=1 Tax=Streptomyces formicae TaxID=1616117 RepID=A0ABY3WN37_9ACTN|nr:hypothetical protein [Streptomyces formicae]UNM13001.1 hypothetical protein J4032_17085 [Streptomyces formicae]